MGRNGLKRNSGQITATTLTVILAASSFAWASSFVSAATLVDRLLAEVNGEAILLSEIQDKVEKGPLIAVSPYPMNDDASQFDLAMHDAINFKLIMQRSEELGIGVDDDRLNEEIERFLARRELSRPQLMDALAQQGMTYEQYREDFRSQMVLNQFQGREILPSVKVTDKDVEIYYLNQVGNSSENVRLVLRQLLIQIDQAASESVKKGKLALVDRIQQELADGMEFDKAARVYSDHKSSRENGGLMAPLNLKDMAPNFRQAISGLSEGEFSQAVETPMGYFFFYLEKKEFAANEEFQRLRPQLEAQLRQEEVVRQTIQWLEDQRRRSDIRIIKS
ncbi:MAG: peptidylprolyl isomerase [Oligoflexus sp.]